jgi:hypothetical protein
MALVIGSAVCSIFLDSISVHRFTVVLDEMNIERERLSFLPREFLADSQGGIES